MNESMQVEQLPNVRARKTFERVLWGLMWLAAVCVLGCLAYRSWRSWVNWGDLNTTSSVWIATADDLVHGTFYRPMISELGYGGTRYAPLRTALQAGLMRVGMGPVNSALVLSLGGTIAMVLGVYVLARRLNTPRGLAIILSVFLLAANGVRVSVLGGLADPLAATLDVAGLIGVTYVATELRGGWKTLAIMGAAVFFVLAMATKVTSVFGIAAGTVFLWTRGKRREALILAAAWVVIALATLGLTQWASGGRMISVFRQSALVGRGIGVIVTGPRKFAYSIFYLDKTSAAFWIIAVGLILIGRRWLELPSILLAATTLVTMAIFSTSGTDINHFIDLDVAAVLCIATTWKVPKYLTAPAWTVLALIALYVCLRMIVEARGMDRLRHRDQLITTAKILENCSGNGPVLCTDALIPILAGERPYLLDGFMYHVLVEKDPAFGVKMRADLSDKRFRVVILANSDKGYWGFRIPGHSNIDLIDEVEANYRLTETFGWYYVFQPKKASEIGRGDAGLELASDRVNGR